MKTFIVVIALFSNICILKSQFNNVPELVDYAARSVVLITTDYSTGSGVVISSKGYIVTNYHVIEEAYLMNSIIKITTSDKSEFNAKVVSIDEDFDLCLLNINSTFNYDPLYLAHPDSLKAGEDVVSIGNPFGVSDFITKGIISKFNTPYVFTSASINPGNSGGALLNMKGELVGITTMQLTDAQNFNIAICTRTVNFFLNKNHITNE